jgi:hypothetical protein
VKALIGRLSIAHGVGLTPFGPRAPRPGWRPRARCAPRFLRGAGATVRAAGTGGTPVRDGSPRGERPAARRGETAPYPLSAMGWRFPMRRVGGEVVESSKEVGVTDHRSSGCAGAGSHADGSRPFRFTLPLRGGLS